MILLGSFYPAKLYGVMPSGPPITAIMSENTEVALTLNEFQCILITSPKDFHALVEAILQLRNNESGRRSGADEKVSIKRFQSIEGFYHYRCSKCGGDYSGFDSLGCLSKL